MFKSSPLIGFGVRGEAYVPTVIGEVYGGGFYMGTLGDYYLVCPPIAGQHGSTIQWKTTNTTTIGTTSLTDGFANTEAMVTAGIGLHPAAQFCVGLTIGGFSDWYYPAKDELNLLYVNRVALTAAGAGSFFSANYSASSEITATNSWLHDFSSDLQSNGNKANSYHVRAIRRVSV